MRVISSKLNYEQYQGLKKKFNFLGNFFDFELSKGLRLSFSIT
jgi:hypothetical protein